MIVPYRLIAEGVLVLVLTGVGTGWWLEHNHKEQAIGAQKCFDQGKANVDRNDAKVEKQETTAASDSAKIGETYAEATRTPVTDAPKFGLCPTPGTAKPRKVLPATAAGPKPDAAPAGGEAPTRDIGTAVVTVGRDSDAQVIALQDYINQVCLAH